MNIEIKEKDGGMVAKIEGRLDTPAAVKAQQEITPLLENADKMITLDCTGLEYIDPIINKDNIISKPPNFPILNPITALVIK